ncbi:hypothetical protein [Mycobacterium sp. SMC-11]|uniref:hypothetical protein n=1 Tax=Mycobacterium sp. SMC-11 TaxID=3385969 RepID=UPI00390CBD14
MIISADQMVSVRTRDGVQAAQFTGAQLTSLRWGWEGGQTTKCTLAVSVDDVAGLDITPWQHWIDVWTPEVNYPVWSGPIQTATKGRDTAGITAADPSVFGRRTRCPITKDWDNTAPAKIAAELWTAMLARHGITVDPIVLTGVDSMRVADGHGDYVDFSVSADEAMMDSVFDRLTQVGLNWSVIGGVPFLGVMPRQPVTTLGERDFIDGGLQLVRDGATTFNDVVLRAADTIARGTVPLGEHNLQTLIHIDNMFGVSNAQTGLRTYLAYMARIRDEVRVPAGARLSPDAPVLLEQLVPTTRMVVDAFDTATLTTVGSMDVTLAAGNCDVAVSLATARDDLPELAKISMQDAS